MRVGICGYPGSGKSTVFGALAPSAAGTGSKGGVTYGNIKVPDARVDALSEVFTTKKTTYAEITFMDMGGERGNAGAFPPNVVQNMRNADVLVHIVRGFENPMLATPADMERDENAFNDELILLDLSIVERLQDRWRREQRKGAEVALVDRCLATLEDNKPLRALNLDEEELASLSGIQLLSVKPLITLYNLSEDAWGDQANDARKPLREVGPGEVALGLCGELEAEIAEMDEEDQAEFLEALGLGEPARYGFIRAAYKLLDLISFLTAGPDECRAWPIRRGLNARKAAGKIHSDIERGFIRVEVYQWQELVEAGSEAALKAVGKMRLEGKDYVVVDGDTCNFRFNV